MNRIARSVELYRSRGVPDTTNSTDRIYTAQTQLTLSGSPVTGYKSPSVLGVEPGIRGG